MHDEPDGLGALHDEVAGGGVRHVADLGDRRLDGLPRARRDVALAVDARGSPCRATRRPRRRRRARWRASAGVGVVTTTHCSCVGALDNADDRAGTLCTFTDSRRVSCRSSNLCTFTHADDVDREHREPRSSRTSRSPQPRRPAPLPAPTASPSAATTTPSSGIAERLARRRRTHARGRRRPRRDQHLRLVRPAEPRPGESTSPRLDEIIDLLHEAGIRVNLGTGTASPPPWLTTPAPRDPARSSPTARPATPAAARPGARARRSSASTPSPSSRPVAERYGDHPAVALWHVSNELGCHNALCYCDASAAAFRALARSERYGTIDALNRAWGTSFWSQRYTRLGRDRHAAADALDAQPGPDARLPPLQLRRAARLLPRRGRGHPQAQRPRRSPPTSWSPRTSANLDYWSWAPEMDVVANDHYLDHRLGDPRRRARLRRRPHPRPRRRARRGC